MTLLIAVFSLWLLPAAVLAGLYLREVLRRQKRLEVGFSTRVVVAPGEARPLLRTAQVPVLHQSDERQPFEVVSGTNAWTLGLN